MSLTHNLSLNWSNGSSRGVRAAVQLIDAVEQGADLPVPDGSTNLNFALTQTQSKIKVFVILSTADVTFKTNSSGSPTDTLALKANQPVFWWAGQNVFACPITGNITGNIYITNASGQQAVVSYRILSDA